MQNDSIKIVHVSDDGETALYNLTVGKATVIKAAPWDDITEYLKSINEQKEVKACQKSNG